MATNEHALTELARRKREHAERVRDSRQRKAREIEVDRAIADAVAAVMTMPMRERHQANFTRALLRAVHVAIRDLSDGRSKEEATREVTRRLASPAARSMVLLARYDREMDEKDAAGGVAQGLAQKPQYSQQGLH